MLSFDFSRLAPAGLSVDSFEDGEAGVIIAAHPASARSRCPDCGRWSARIHSRYRRILNDLPIGGRRVQLVVRARLQLERSRGC
jgi:transposase